MNLNLLLNPRLESLLLPEIPHSTYFAMGMLRDGHLITRNQKNRPVLKGAKI